jgi:hypothetical protein
VVLVNKSAWTSEGRTRTARSAASALPLPLPSGFLSLLVYAEHSEHLRRERMVVSTGDNTPCAMNAQNHGKDEQGIDWQSTLDTYLDRFVEIGHSGGMICTAASRENTSCGRRRLPWKRTVAVRGGRVSCNAPSHRLALAAGRRATASQAPPCRHGRLRPPANLTAGNEGARRAQHLRERGVHLVDIPDALAAISAIDINLWHCSPDTQGRINRLLADNPLGSFTTRGSQNPFFGVMNGRP